MPAARQAGAFRPAEGTMDFDLTDEQRLLKDSVDRLIADHYQFEQRKKYMTEPDGWSRGVWNQYAELGLLGLPFAEAHGGFGGSAVEAMIVMEAFGRGLVLEPYFATVILGGGLVRRAASAAQQQTLLPQITQGKLKLAFAHVERQSQRRRVAMAPIGSWTAPRASCCTAIARTRCW
jgi:alkylation response protein AidB-like acyl-CoA dehydrogenase